MNERQKSDDLRSNFQYKPITIPLIIDRTGFHGTGEYPNRFSIRGGATVRKKLIPFLLAIVLSVYTRRIKKK